jgi:hypothetical protein
MLLLSAAIAVAKSLKSLSASSRLECGTQLPVARKADH